MMVSILILILILIAVGVFAIVMKRKESNAVSRFFSISSITEKLLLLIQRFPISILLVVGLAVLFFVAINKDFDDISYQLWIFFSIGAIISITATLFSEDHFNNLKTYGITLAAVLLWGMYCVVFLPEKFDDVQTGKGIEIFVIGGTAFFAILFISFLKKNKDRAFWSFSSQTIFQLALASIFGAILFGGLSLALLAIDSLFNASIDEKLYGYLAVICLALFTPIYFLANIPNKTEKHNNELFYSKIQKIFALHILSPILAIYAVILYAYLFKIIAVWELPNGWVSWLVSALGLGGLLVIMLLYPAREQGNNKMVNFISRWFGLLILPLLVLMTIGIFRRIGDYGITINRGYILLLNFWFYGIYIYLFFSKSRHIKWILISLVAVAFFTSVNVWGVANVTKNSLTKEINAVLNKQVSAEEARAIFAEMTREEKDRMKSILEYLHENFGKESVQPFFTYTVLDNSWNFLSKLDLDIDKIEFVKGESFSYVNHEHENTLNIEKYYRFLPISYNRWRTNSNIDYSAEKEEITVILADDRVFSIPIREMVIEHRNTDERIKNRKEWIIQGDDYTVWIRGFDGTYYQENDSINMDRLHGNLFYK